MCPIFIGRPLVWSFNFGGGVKLRPSPDRGALENATTFHWCRSPTIPLCHKLDAHSNIWVFYACISTTYASRTFLRPRAASAPKPRPPESLFLKLGGQAHTPKRSKNVKVRWQTRRPLLIPRPTNAFAYTPIILRTFGPLSLPRSSPRIWISRRNNNGMSLSNFSPGRSPDPCDGGPSLKGDIRNNC
jgi:hypothetical protein